MPRTPSPRRLIDPRLLIGVLLVALSVAGTVVLVASLDVRTTVVAASAAVTPGDRITRDELVERTVWLDGAEALYLRAAAIPEEGLIVTRPVRAGELVPLTAVGDAAGVRSTVLVLRLSSPVGSGVQPGSSVDVWASPADPETRGYGAPIVLIPGAVVVRVVSEEGLVSSSSSAEVEVLVPRSKVARVLHAQAAGDALAVVPVGLSWGG